MIDLFCYKVYARRSIVNAWTGPRFRCKPFRLFFIQWFRTLVIDQTCEPWLSGGRICRSLRPSISSFSTKYSSGCSFFLAPSAPSRYMTLALKPSSSKAVLIACSARPCSRLGRLCRRARAGPVQPAASRGGGRRAQRRGIHLAGGPQQGRQAGHPHASPVHSTRCWRAPIRPPGTDPHRVTMLIAR